MHTSVHAHRLHAPREARASFAEHSPGVTSGPEAVAVVRAVCPGQSRAGCRPPRPSVQWLQWKTGLGEEPVPGSLLCGEGFLSGK